MSLPLHFPRDEKPAPGTSRDGSGMYPETFEVFIDDDRYAVPTLHLVTASNRAAAVSIAQRLLAESPHHLGAELCLDGQRIAGLGSFATRQAPPGVSSRQSAEA